MSWIIILLALILIVLFFLFGYVRGTLEIKPGPSEEIVRKVEEIRKKPVKVAIEELKRLVNTIRIEDKPFVYYNIALLYMDSGQYRRALRLLRSIIVSPYIHGELKDRLVILIGEIYLRMGRYGDALEFLTEHPVESDRYYYLLAKTYEHVGKYSSALKTYARIMSSIEKDQFVNIHARMAIEAARRGELEKSQEIIVRGSKYGETPLLEAARGILAYYEGNLERAVNFLSSALEKDWSFYVYIRDELRDAYYDLGKYDNLLEILRNSSNAIAKVDYIRILVNMGERERAHQFMMENADMLFSSAGLIARLYRIFPEKELVEKLVELSMKSPIYRCQACGYETDTYKVECPSCFRIASLRLKQPPISSETREAIDATTPEFPEI